MAAQSPLRKVLDLAEKFVASRKGEWNHTDWEQLLDDARKLGYPCDDDECRRNLGNILESCKYFYAYTPAGAAAHSRKPAARKRAAS